MAEISNNPRRTVLLVHGSDFKPPADVYLEDASNAIQRGLARDYPDTPGVYEKLTIELAYYGDLGNELLLAQGKQYDEQLDIGDRRSALEQLKRIRSRKRFGLQQYDKLRGKSAIPEAIADVASPVLGSLGMTPLLVSLVAKDFAVYIRGDTDFTEQVRARLRDRVCAIMDRGDELMLMAHGTGCVVAYEVLWQLTHDDRFEKYRESKVDLFVTLGSPLSDNKIRKRLLGAKNPPSTRFPQNIITWQNLSAEDDYACHDKTVADDFRIMMREHVISSINDFRIYNHTMRYGKSNPHCSLGYFIHPRVAKIIVDWTGDQPVPAPE
jgi:hypothetical protein